MSKENPTNYPLWGILVKNKSLKYAMGSQFPVPRILLIINYKEIKKKKWRKTFNKILKYAF